MADWSHLGGADLSNPPYQQLDAPTGFPHTGEQPALAGLQSWNVTAATPQVVQLPSSHSNACQFIRLDIVTLTAETYAVLASFDGGATYPEAPSIYNFLDRSVANPATLGVGNYYVAPNCAYTTLKLTKSGAVNPGVGACAWGFFPKG